MENNLVLEWSLILDNNLFIIHQKHKSSQIYFHSVALNLSNKKAG